MARNPSFPRAPRCALPARVLTSFPAADLPAVRRCAGELEPITILGIPATWSTVSTFFTGVALLGSIFGSQILQVIGAHYGVDTSIFDSLFS